MLEQIQKEDRASSEREEKLKEFQELKERIAKITKKKELSQAEFDKYIKSLNLQEPCKYALGIRDVMALCNNSLFKCEFRSQDKYRVGHHGSRFECKRKRMLKLKSLL